MSADPWYQLATINGWDVATKLALAESFLRSTGQTIQLAKFAADRARVLETPQEIDRAELQKLGFDTIKLGTGFKWMCTQRGITVVGQWPYETVDMAWRAAYAAAKLRGEVGAEMINPEPEARIA